MGFGSPAKKKEGRPKPPLPLRVLYLAWDVPDFLLIGAPRTPQ